MPCMLRSSTTPWQDVQCSRAAGTNEPKQTNKNEKKKDNQRFNVHKRRRMIDTANQVAEAKPQRQSRCFYVDLLFTCLHAVESRNIEHRTERV